MINVKDPLIFVTLKREKTPQKKRLNRHGALKSIQTFITNDNNVVQRRCDGHGTSIFVHRYIFIYLL